MSEANSTPLPPANKTIKPPAKFPLFRHRSGQWAKKILGRTIYFGTDIESALAKYNREKAALHEGRLPRGDTVPGEVTVRELANEYLNDKREKVASKEVQPRTLKDYNDACDLMVEHFGKSRPVSDLQPGDFAKLRAAMSKKWGLLRLRDFIVRIRGVFKFGEKNLMLKPAYFGSRFDPPSDKSIRIQKAEKGDRDFQADELKAIIDAAPMPLKAMILLGINCGFGNADVGRLPLTAVDLKTGWIKFPRPKTGIDRRCPLWPETIEAIRSWLSLRPKAKNPTNDGLVFLTRTGDSWHKQPVRKPDGSWLVKEDNPISKETRKLLDKLGINGNKNFYGFRKTFATQGGETTDQVAVDYVMGHAPPSNDMPARYRQRISDGRLQAVVNHVHAWLFHSPEPTANDEPRDVIPITQPA